MVKFPPGNICEPFKTWAANDRKVKAAGNKVINNNNNIQNIIVSSFQSAFCFVWCLKQ